MTQRVFQLIEKDSARSGAGEQISHLPRESLISGRDRVPSSGGWAVVVGGVNVDIGGRSFAPLVAADSNPGRVTVSLGGVGRNIAHNLSLLGVEVHLLTAYGGDAHGDRVAASCRELGIDLHHALRVPDAATSTYLYLADDRGEMALAVSDMALCEKITPAYLAAQLPLLQNARVVVADANLPADSLAYLAENSAAPLFVDPVSTAKAEKLRPILSRIHTLKPNVLEASILSGVEIRDSKDAERAAEALTELGVSRIFLSMGERGVCAVTGSQRLWLPTLPGNRVNTTGCGDAFLAALVWAYLEGMDLEHTALAGLAAGAIAMESPETINPALSAAALEKRMGRR